MTDIHRLTWPHAVVKGRTDNASIRAVDALDQGTAEQVAEGLAAINQGFVSMFRVADPSLLAGLFVAPDAYDNLGVWRTNPDRVDFPTCVLERHSVSDDALWEGIVRMLDRAAT